jgi:hypothetical protein
LNPTELVAELANTLVQDAQKQIAKQIKDDITDKLSHIDVKQIVRECVNTSIASLISNYSFPDNSINSSAINIHDLIMSGDNVVGGIIKGFGSTGIQDSASQCQVTILDDATVIENKLISKELDVKGQANIEGDLYIDGDIHLTGEIPADSPFYKDMVQHAAGLLKLSMNSEFFLQYSTQLFDKIKIDGIDLNKLTLNGNEILSGNRLGYFVTDTNIQKLGELKSLRVNGETDLTNTIFIRNKRVGINTEEPTGALTVWDEECEFSVRKLKKDVSIIGATRNQQVILSSNNKENLILEPSGKVTIENLTIGKVHFSSSPICPTHDVKAGIIVVNENPTIGQPLFWVSLGGARWANVGVIS